MNLLVDSIRDLHTLAPDYVVLMRCRGFYGRIFFSALQSANLRVFFRKKKKINPMFVMINFNPDVFLRQIQHLWA